LLVEAVGGVRAVKRELEGYTIFWGKEEGERKSESVAPLAICVVAFGDPALMGWAKVCPAYGTGDARGQRAGSQFAGSSLQFRVEEETSLQGRLPLLPGSAG